MEALVLPELPATDAGAGAGTAPVEVPPSPRFRVVHGRVKYAQIVRSLRNLSSGNTAAKRAGLKYEEEVAKWLYCYALARSGWRFIESPEIVFADDRGTQFAVPDGIMMTEEFTCVIEVKLQHMPEAWWQLRRKYEPIARHLTGRNVMLLEVCKTYDLQMPFPEKHRLYRSFDEYFAEAKPGELGVLQWKP
jgi:hypothetical protein